MRLVLLTELNIIRVLWRSLFDRDAYIVGRMPLLPRFDSVLAAAQRWMIGRGMARDIFELFPDERRWADIPTFRGRSKMFPTTEPWAEDHLRYARWPLDWAPYGLAFRQLAVKYLAGYFVPADLVRLTRERFGGAAIEIVGGNRDFLAFLDRSCGDLGVCARPAIEPRWAVNAVIFLAVSVIALVWLTLRLRFRRGAEEPVFLGVDYHGRLEDIRIIDDIVGVDAGVVFVYRNASVSNGPQPIGPSRRTASVADGRFDIADGRRALGIVLGDGWRIFRLGGGYSPRFYFELAKMPLRRLAFFGLCRRFRFANFWSRDDYNFEHILRTHELRWAGARSLGINHGLPTPEIFQPSWRYIDFDFYYVFGRHLYETYYRDTWSSSMAVRAIGTTGVSRTQLATPRVARKPDFVFYSVVLNGAETLAAAFDVARAFPDRKMLVKIKETRREDGLANDLIAMCDSAPANVEVTMRDSYELMYEAEYALTGSSTVAVEAIQMGMKTFVLDLLPRDRPFYYRDFPGICVRSADEAAARIRAIDRHEACYPWDQLDQLVDLSGQNPYDAIRADMQDQSQ